MGIDRALCSTKTTLARISTVAGDLHSALWCFESQTSLGEMANCLFNQTGSSGVWIARAVPLHRQIAFEAVRLEVAEGARHVDVNSAAIGTDFLIFDMADATRMRKHGIDAGVGMFL